MFPGEKGVEFWRRLWDTFKLEERLRVLDDREEDHVPPGLNRTHLEDLLAEAPDDVRFHISRGAGESFANTLPLLHPRGYLQVQDIFVSDMDDYRKGFRGPGKLDGSLVTWVNGALLRAVGARAGYDVHFAPFPYRPGTKTSILYTTQRDLGVAEARDERETQKKNRHNYDVAIAHSSNDRHRQLLDARVARAREERVPVAPPEPP